jgi:hypothetical protein
MWYRKFFLGLKKPRLVEKYLALKMDIFGRHCTKNTAPHDILCSASVFPFLASVMRRKRRALRMWCEQTPWTLRWPPAVSPSRWRKTYRQDFLTGKISAAFAMSRIRIRIRIHMLLGFPDPDPLVRGRVWIRIRILPSCKNSKKNLDSYYFATLFDFLSLKKDVNVPSKSNKQMYHRERI